MTARPEGRRGPPDPVEEHRNLALKAAVEGESFLVPIELATLLAVGGDHGIDGTAVIWLSMLESRAAKGLGKSGLAVVDQCVSVFALDDEVRAVTIELVRAQPAPPNSVAGWREFELGQRAQVLLVIAHLVARKPAAGPRASRAPHTTGAAVPAPSSGH